MSAWGVVDLHETGFRAEWMQVEAIIVGTRSHKHLGTRIDLMPAWEALAERYAVPLIDEEDVDTFCWERGEVLDSRDLAAERALPPDKSLQEAFSELARALKRIQEPKQSKRNQPAFWRGAAGGDVHNGH